MKVLFVFSIGHLDGGAAKVWLSLIDGLRAHGSEPYVVMPQTKDESMLRALDKMKVPYWIEFFTWWTAGDKNPGSLKRRLRRAVARKVNAKAERKILDIIKREKIDCLVIEDGTIEAGLKAAKAANIPVVWHIHEFLSLCDKANHESGAQYFIDPAKHVEDKFAQADVIIAVSDAIRKNLEKQFTQLNNVTSLHNGISSENVAKNKGEILQNDTVQFTMAQRFDENKDQLTCVKAFAKVADKYPQANLKFVGGGSAEYIEKVKRVACSLNCSERISFCGNSDDMASVWKETDVAINCSHSEGCSISAAECMQSGCLHIASNCAGNIELLKDGRGLLFDKGNPDSLAKQMSWAIENAQEAREIAQRGKTWALKEFSMDKFLDAFENILHGAINKRCGGAA